MGEVVSPTTQRTGDDNESVRSPSLGSDGSLIEHDVDDIDIEDDNESSQPPGIKLEQTQPQKRKGGRKPIYATSEERKQRNRQAQAAFRERRTEYIKQLESKIKSQQDNLDGLSQSQRTAMDECMMLRYKNSLLERILLEKGIDVQMELSSHGSPTLAPQTGTTVSNASAPHGIQRPQQARFPRRPVSISSNPDNMPLNRSPLAQAVPGSHLASPAILARSPNFIPQNGPISPSYTTPTPQSSQLRPQPQAIRPQPGSQGARPAFAQNQSGGPNVPNGSRDSSNFYIPPFQSHYDQLEQEYESQANMMDDENDSQAFSNNHFVNNAMRPPQTPGLPPNIPPISPITQQPLHSSHGMAPSSVQVANGTPAITPQQQFESFDPTLDADPFGLSASMQYPTNYSYNTHQ